MQRYMIIWNASDSNSFHIAEFDGSDFAMEIKCDVRLMEFGLILWRISLVHIHNSIKIMINQFIALIK